MDSDVESVFDDYQDESDAYSPEPKPKAKATAKKAVAAKPAAKAAPKKSVQTTLKTKIAPKKRAKPSSDDDDNSSFDGNMSNTPPNAKKQKKDSAPKVGGGKPLSEIENDSAMQLDDPTDSKPSKKKTATEQYTKLSPVEHILIRPDTYIGSIERTESQMWVYNKERALMEHKSIKLVPGFYKIFDEILVNAADNKQRDKSMSYIKININREEGEISVENDGKGIPVEMHEKEGVYIPELVFGHLLAGSNFDDNEKKTVGGRNGYGAKLCNVFSKEFTLECQDSTNGKRYKATWRDNMGKMDKHKITSNKSKDFVRVSFKPDFARFDMTDGIDDDTESIMYRRVYDLAGTVEGVKVYLNGEHLKVGFKKYCEMYAKAIAKDRQDLDADGSGPPPATVIFEDTKAHERWQIGFTVSDGSFQQVSFVNSIATTSGGTHVNYIADQICGALLKDLTKKMKGHSLKANHVRNHIFIFVNCLVNNPAFNSQTKEYMTTKPSAFGSKCGLTDGFINKIRKTEAIENILHFAEKKADKMMAKTDGNKRSRISNEKLVDANLAGTKHGHECTLILTEGDSARGLAVAGRAILDPDRIGVFPLRGKMLNVRDASIDQILKNQEISNIKQFMGLKHKETYTDTKRLRYGHLMIMADQDHDGSHIKGLLINFLQVQFPSLLQIPDFFREFTTPVVKVWQGPNPKKPLKMRSFFTMPEYEEWKERHHDDIKRWQYKYFKGLGTSTNEDAQVYFTDLDNHLKEFHTMKPEETELFELAFSKKKADARKEWLGRFVPGTFLDHSTKSITYSDFVNKELILFSMADNLRSIPSVVDGLKPGQRKVVFACFKRNLIKDKKVVELAGYVSEQTAYHHGEASLQQTIVGLAQNFVGSNNINVLEPSGNFGSRLAGGSDAASARYIFTRLSPFARRVFSPLDEPVLEAQFEDGKQIEPKIYAPVIPMVLCNGADGIGTGWSTSIPNYHPMDIVNNLKRRMGRLDGPSEEAPFETMIPWFRGWKGQAEPDGTGKYKFNGIATQEKPNEILVTELPVRVWTDDFKARLEQIIRGDKGLSWIKDYKEFNDHRNVHFEIQMDDKVIKKALDDNELLEKFKLTKSIGTTNLVAFDPRGQIRKYDNVEQILEEFYLYRLNVYTERRAHWLQVLDDDYERLKNMARFVEEIISGKLVVARKKKTALVEELRKAKYRPFPKDDTGKKAKNTDEEMDQEEDADKEDDLDDSNPSAGDYDYLLSMQIYSLTLERLERLKRQIAKKKAEKDELEALDEKDLWCRDLDAFVEEWENQMRLDDEIRTNIRKMGRRHSKKIGAGKGGKRAKKDDDDYDPGSKLSKSRPGMAKPGRMVKTVISPVKTTAQQRFASHFAKPTTPAPTGNDGTAESDEEFTVESFKREAPTTARPVRAKKPSILAELSDDSDEDFEALLDPKTKTQPAAIPTETTTDADDEDIVPTSKAKAADAAPVKEPSPVANHSEDEDEDFAALSRPKTRPRAATAKKPPPVADRSDDDQDFALLDQPKSQSKAAPKKKPSPVIDIISDDDEDFDAPAKPKSKAKAVVAKKPSAVVDLSDDDEEVAVVSKRKTKAASTEKPSPADSELDQEPEPEVEEPKPTTGRSKRAAASKAKKWVFDESDEESESNGDNIIDVGSLVRGIGEPAADATNGRLSLFAMSRSDHGNAPIPKLKTKQARTNFDVDSFDDTNYEMLAKSSPHRATKSSDVEMSENEDEAVVPKGAAKGKQALNVASAAKKRGRPANSKNLKAKEETTINKLSPVAKTKTSAATSKAKKDIFDFTDDEDEDGDVRMGGSTPAIQSRAASGRPGRAAAAKKSYVLPSDDDSMSDAGGAESELSGSD